MFNKKLNDKISALEYQIKELKRQTMGDDKECDTKGNAHYDKASGNWFLTGHFFYDGFRPTSASLKHEMEDLDLRIDAILKHLGLDDKKVDKVTTPEKFVVFKPKKEKKGKK